MGVLRYLCLRTSNPEYPLTDESQALEQSFPPAKEKANSLGVRLPEGWRQLLDVTAKKQGITVNAFIVRQIQRGIMDASGIGESK